MIAAHDVHVSAVHVILDFNVRRTTVKIMPAGTITVYAAQGGAFKAIIADMQRPPDLGAAKHWLACYVMLSRAKTLKGLLLLRMPTMQELNAGPPKQVFHEIHRLLDMERQTWHKLLMYSMGMSRA